MLFLFKKKPLTFTAFVSEEFAFANTYSPITSIKQTIPSWWKNMPPGEFNWDTLTSTSNTKHCVGIINSFTTGFILPAWTEMAISITPERWEARAADRKTPMDVHPNGQAKGFYSNYIFLKIVSPWVIECSEKGIDLMFNFPFYHYTEPREYITPSGITSPTNKKYSTNVFVFFKKDYFKCMIGLNDPLLHIIPITDREYTIKTEVLSYSEFNKKDSDIAKKPRFFRNGINVVKLTS